MTVSMMLAARLIKPGQPLKMEQLPVPEPGPDEVLVQVEACGLCGTDLHLAVEGSIPVARTPITLGHEAAGVVRGVGGGLSGGMQEGDRVVLFPSAFCGACRFCAVGRHSLCERSMVYGMGRDGALAHYIVAPARSVTRLPDAVPFDVGAVITDGVATPFHALRSRGALRAGETVGVFGCGGLGTHAILLAQMMGAARVVAVDTDAPARERALRLGADLAIDPASSKTDRVVREQLGCGGLDLAMEFVGLPETVDLAVRCLDKGGRAVVAGVGPGRPILPPLLAFVGREKAVLGSFGMDMADIEDLLALVSAGRLDLSESVSARYPLEQTNAALQHLASKAEGVVRIVVLPGSE